MVSSRSLSFVMPGMSETLQPMMFCINWLDFFEYVPATGGIRLNHAITS